MPKFEIEGYGKKTHRDRKKVYSADTEDQARKKAKRDGTVILSVKELPPGPATERQIDYALHLGVIIPSGANVVEASDMIYFATDKDTPATQNTLEAADYFGVKRTPYAGETGLYRLIFEQLILPGREKDLARWFAYNVYRDRTRTRSDNSLNGITDSRIDSLANELYFDDRVISSIKRYSGLGLIRFGERRVVNGEVSEAGSIRTTAYKAASRIVDSMCPPRSVNPANSPNRSRSASEKFGAQGRYKKVQPISLIALVFLAIFVTAIVF